MNSTVVIGCGTMGGGIAMNFANVNSIYRNENLKLLQRA